MLLARGGCLEAVPSRTLTVRDIAGVSLLLQGLTLILMSAIDALALSGHGMSAG